MPFNFKISYGGHKAYDYGGHPAPAGRALPNLINAVKMLKPKTALVLANAEINKLTLTLNILTAFIRLGRAGPVGAGCPP